MKEKIVVPSLIVITVISFFTALLTALLCIRDAASVKEAFATVLFTTTPILALCGFGLIGLYAVFDDR